MVFPNSNLSTSAQPWGRVVQKSIGALETLVATERVNNAARDKQAALSIERLDQSVVGLAAQQTATAANAAATAAIVNNIYKVNTTEIDGQKVATGTISSDQISATYVYAGSIDADQINAGTLTGFTINTASSGARVSMSGTEIIFIDSSNTQVGRMRSNGTDTMAILGPSGNNITFIPQGISFSGFVFFGGASFTSIGNDGPYTGNGGSANITVGGSITRTAVAGSSTTGASFTATGALVRTSSSARYKQDIENIDFNYEDVLNLQPKKFRLKDDVAHSPEAPFHVGFVAEDLAGTPLDIFVNYKEINNKMVPDGVQYLGMTAMLVSAIKHQDELIKSLTFRIEALENN